MRRSWNITERRIESMKGVPTYVPFDDVASPFARKCPARLSMRPVRTKIKHVIVVVVSQGVLKIRGYDSAIAI